MCVVMCEKCFLVLKTCLIWPEMHRNYLSWIPSLKFLSEVHGGRTKPPKPLLGARAELVWRKRRLTGISSSHSHQLFTLITRCVSYHSHTPSILHLPILSRCYMTYTALWRRKTRPKPKESSSEIKATENIVYQFRSKSNMTNIISLIILSVYS